MGDGKMKTIILEKSKAWGYLEKTTKDKTRSCKHELDRRQPDGK